jgi:hypothetical protein
MKDVFSACCYCQRKWVFHWRKFRAIVNKHPPGHTHHSLGWTSTELITDTTYHPSSFMFPDNCTGGCSGSLWGCKIWRKFNLCMVLHHLKIILRCGTSSKLNTISVVQLHWCASYPNGPSAPTATSAMWGMDDGCAWYSFPLSSHSLASNGGSLKFLFLLLIYDQPLTFKYVHFTCD